VHGRYLSRSHARYSSVPNRSPPTNAVPTITTARTSPNRSAVHASTSPPETPVVAAATTHQRPIGLTSFLIVVVRRPQRPVHQRHRHAYGGDDDARPHGQRRLRREGEQEQHAADGHPQPAEPGAGGAGHWGLRGWGGVVVVPSGYTGSERFRVRSTACIPMVRTGPGSYVFGQRIPGHAGLSGVGAKEPR